MASETSYFFSFEDLSYFLNFSHVTILVNFLNSKCITHPLEAVLSSVCRNIKHLQIIILFILL